MSPTERPGELFPGERHIVGVVVGVLVMGAYIVLDLNGWSLWYRLLASTFVLVMSIIVLGEVRDAVSRRNRRKATPASDGEAPNPDPEEAGEDQPSVEDDHRPGLEALVAEALRKSEAIKREADRFGNAGGTLGIFTGSRINTAVRKAQEASATQDDAAATLLAQRAIRLAEKAVVGLEYARRNAPQAAAKEFAAVAKEAKRELRRSEEAAASKENDAEILRAKRIWKEAKETSKSYRERAKELKHPLSEKSAQSRKAGGCGRDIVLLILSILGYILAVCFAVFFLFWSCGMLLTDCFSLFGL